MDMFYCVALLLGGFIHKLIVLYYLYNEINKIYFPLRGFCTDRKIQIHTFMVLWKNIMVEFNTYEYCVTSNRYTYTIGCIFMPIFKKNIWRNKLFMKTIEIIIQTLFTKIVCQMKIYRRFLLALLYW